MSYVPATDFLALLRQTSAGVALERMPGLDYVVAALSRAGLFQFFIGQTSPTANQQSTVWFQPAQPSWTAEGLVFLWNASTGAYQLATPALWKALLGFGGYVFQSVVNLADTVAINTTLLAIQRNGPTITTLTMPSVAIRGTTPLQITDWSTCVVNHQVILSPAAGDSIARNTSFTLLSTPDQLASITLQPSPELNGWVIK